MHKLIGMLLLALAGCGGSASPPIPPTTGDFVRNNGSVGTAKVFSIEFRVNVTSNGATFEDLINARKRFTFGKDITIQLESVDESVVGFIFNDQDYGNLNVGDQVVIDDERNVEVNGTPRPPKSRE